LSDTSSTHRFLVKYSKAMKSHSVFAERGQVANICRNENELDVNKVTAKNELQSPPPRSNSCS